MKDPLVVLTWIVGAMLLLVFGRYAVTGQLDEKVLTGMGTILGGLITALATRKKGGDDDGSPNP
ncbi:hypothetical protein GCM10008959_34400 [Deinococcus seoulensis]|uniref:Uncharacterized protein n=1 Tax=Deinococcus seoulensis TaxID=1837379 RepID=A0ABQ2RZD7_9DEIO|nr:hypothetical protein [Deinococcus seoulensis]GGR69615.1 hypothetical protein GCM10008959_34400 [Deinococcus seoulensis]